VGSTPISRLIFEALLQKLSGCLRTKFYKVIDFFW